MTSAAKLLLTLVCSALWITVFTDASIAASKRSKAGNDEYSCTGTINWISVTGTGAGSQELDVSQETQSPPPCVSQTYRAAGDVLPGAFAGFVLIVQTAMDWHCPVLIHSEAPATLIARKLDWVELDAARCDFARSFPRKQEKDKLTYNNPSKNDVRLAFIRGLLGWKQENPVCTVRDVDLVDFVRLQAFLLG